MRTAGTTEPIRLSQSVLDLVTIIEVVSRRDLERQQSRRLMLGIEMSALAGSRRQYLQKHSKIPHSNSDVPFEERCQKISHISGATPDQP